MAQAQEHLSYIVVDVYHDKHHTARDILDDVYAFMYSAMCAHGSTPDNMPHEWESRAIVEFGRLGFKFWWEHGEDYPWGRWLPTAPRASIGPR